MIDINFDFQAEAGFDKKGIQRDSDKYSPTLQEYHRILWSKQLPSGDIFKLTKVSDNRLYHKSKTGEFYLSSDRAIPTFLKWTKMKHVVEQIPDDELASFISLGNTIGGIILWPSNRIDGLPTINGARGLNPLISDRLDVTLECIRLYYQGRTSPLSETFSRYQAFFSLFRDFKGYVDFFLFQNWVEADYQSVKVAHPFDNFESPSIPKTPDEYRDYMQAVSELVMARNQRIKDFVLEKELLSN